MEVHKVSTHIRGLVVQVAEELRVKAEKLSVRPTKEMQDDFWVNTLHVSAILLRCLNSAFLSDKQISKIYQLNRPTRSEVGFTIYGIPVTSDDPDRDYDFLVLDGCGHMSSGYYMTIRKTDVVTVWYTFKS